MSEHELRARLRDLATSWQRAAATFPPGQAAAVHGCISELEAELEDLGPNCGLGHDPRRISCADTAGLVYAGPAPGAYMHAEAGDHTHLRRAGKDPYPCP